VPHKHVRNCPTLATVKRPRRRKSLPTMRVQHRTLRFARVGNATIRQRSTCALSQLDLGEVPRLGWSNRVLELRQSRTEFSAVRRHGTFASIWRLSDLLPESTYRLSPTHARVDRFAAVVNRFWGMLPSVSDAWQR
jgi:hypothetical protein